MAGPEAARNGLDGLYLGHAYLISGRNDLVRVDFQAPARRDRKLASQPDFSTLPK